MKLILDDGIEVVLDRLQVAEVKSNQVVMFSTKEDPMMKSLLDSREALESIFHPAKVFIFPNDLKVEIIEAKDIKG